MSSAVVGTRHASSWRRSDAVGWTRLDVLLLPPLLCPVNKQRNGQLIPSNQNRQEKLNAEQVAGLDEARIYIIVRFNEGKR